MDIINITYNGLTIQICITENGINIDNNILNLFKDKRGKMSIKSFINQPLIKFIYNWIMIVDEAIEKQDKNDIIIININSFEFEMDIYEANIMVDPSIRNLFLNKKGKPLTSNQFNKQPLIDFIARLSMINKIKKIYE